MLTIKWLRSLDLNLCSCRKLNDRPGDRVERKKLVLSAERGQRPTMRANEGAEDVEVRVYGILLAH